MSRASSSMASKTLAYPVADFDLVDDDEHVLVSRSYLGLTVKDNVPVAGGAGGNPARFPVDRAIIKPSRAKTAQKRRPGRAVVRAFSFYAFEE
ncbi:hypothetical protein TR75_06670 [Hydrogenibacillus schlegelii]|uniref:Uncharacterized protein n=3 Tax=Hydrogenibacillus schlegelii TaxID=1484 RepID=A0A132N7U2_HYDSH|nr:hypothetical protein TR75_06670 [Hydrogenibacillus schlegelii]OAR04944.1 hypothetical protein SA87_04505 [Hydrogenibacillus schlegelii]